MTSRLLAFALACIIGSPTCWCCLPHGADAPKTAARSCCHGGTDGASTKSKAPTKRQDCPCATSQTQRELADGKMMAPKPVMASDIAPSYPVQVLPAVVGIRHGPIHVDEDPPWRSAKLYLRHCSRLL